MRMRMQSRPRSSHRSHARCLAVKCGPVDCGRVTRSQVRLRSSVVYQWRLNPDCPVGGGGGFTIKDYIRRFESGAPGWLRRCLRRCDDCSFAPVLAVRRDSVEYTMPVVGPTPGFVIEPNPGVAPEAFVLGPHGPALQLTPTKALLCRIDIDLMKSVLGGSVNAAEMYVRLQSQPFERRAINPLVHRIVEFDPPLAALGDVWKRTGTGFGGESDLTPFLRVAGTDRWLRADAHVHTAL